VEIKGKATPYPKDKKSNAMKILLLGGTGAMGKHLTEILLEEDNQVFVTTRSKRPPLHPHLTYLQGNAKEESFIAETLQLGPWDAIVDFMIYNTQEFQNHYKALLSATNHYLFLSSSRVYAESNLPIQEDSPRLIDQSTDEKFLRTDEYSLTKARQENLLQSSEKQNWTIIRPYITYSEERLQLGTLEKEIWLYRALHGRSILFTEEIGSKLTTLSYGRDVALGIKSIIGQTKVFGKAIHIVQPKAITWQEALQLYIQLLSNHLGETPVVKFVDLKTFLTLQHSPYQVLYDRKYDRIFSTKRIDQYIDTNLFTSPLNGLASCLKYFFEHPNFSTINWFAQARIDKICKERTPLKEIPTTKDRILYLCVRYLPLIAIHHLWSFTTHLKRIIKS